MKNTQERVTDNGLCACDNPKPYHSNTHQFTQNMSVKKFSCSNCNRHIDWRTDRQLHGGVHGNTKNFGTSPANLLFPAAMAARCEMTPADSSRRLLRGLPSNSRQLPCDLSPDEPESDVHHQVSRPDKQVYTKTDA